MCFPNIYRYIVETFYSKQEKKCLLILMPDEEPEIIYYQHLQDNPL